MDDVAAFLSTVVPRLAEEVVALHHGDVGPRMALWSHDEPVTLFGAGAGPAVWTRDVADLSPPTRWRCSSGMARVLVTMTVAESDPTANG